MRKIKLYLKKFDWVIFSSVILLACFGLIEIYSVALGQETLNLLNFQKQIFFIILGIILLFIFAFIDVHWINSHSKYIYILGVLLLVLVLLFGHTVRGTRGWFHLAGFSLQPVEFIKIIMIIFLSRFFSRIGSGVKDFKALFVSGVGALILVGLVLLQPDFGSALILFSIWIFMLFVAGFPKKYFIILGAVLIVVSFVLWSFLFQDYQKNRILTFLEPTNNSLSDGYNISQAIIAVGSGGLTGRGVGFGSQSQLKFLPEAQNDFIFAVISEELGFLGVSLIITFFLIFFMRLFLNLKKINNDFGIFFILGSLGLIFVQMFINIGMNVGIMPVVGISLPFISYGGSAMLANFIIIGIIENIIIKSKINY